MTHGGEDGLLCHRSVGWMDVTARLVSPRPRLYPPGGTEAPSQCGERAVMPIANTVHHPSLGLR